MFARNVRRAMFAGRRPMSTTGGQLPITALSLHRSFPHTLYKVNPGERSNVVGPCSEHSYERDEVEDFREGLVYPAITNSGLSPVFGTFAFGILTAPSTTWAVIFPPHTLAPGASKDDLGMVY